ncbi:hypothetical protein HK099_004550 [Clydaea vesicula]|uniref:Cytochrome c oxidase assembly protein COX20, mitochondrial n=1 Tax=Clydaea vesicula TaxID=447962 RepID=A0AAD5U4Y8_9FUNG|nr:hypothetical protein HK099_004550 [Clydaea vesicula]KAJ3391911.1 hypothetical protein HDU92_008757 [Lobulomyces angularis]
MSDKKLSSDPKDVIKDIHAADFKPSNFLSMPCSKKALLYGVAAGSSIGLIRFYVSQRLRSAGHFAVFTFAGVSILSWEYCRYQRRLVQIELDKMGQQEK